MKNIDELRKEIDTLDNELKELFLKRMAIVDEIKEYKKINDLNTQDSSRENSLKNRLLNDEFCYKDYYNEFLNNILSLSKSYQNEDDLFVNDFSSTKIYYDNYLAINKIKNNYNKTLFLVDNKLKDIPYFKNIIDNEYVFFVEALEENKTIDTVIGIFDYLIKNEFNRSDAIVAVGGGIICDLAGVVCSNYKRGIDEYLIPTTTLSMVDAAIGGKNAVNMFGIKNVLGSFKLPKGVIIDVKTLDSLEEKEFNSGILESLKMGLTLNKRLAELIIDNNVKDNLLNIIKESIDTKINVVKNDYKDNNLRKVLNFGHTIGHAIESLDNGKLPHGYYVGYGMLLCSSNDVKNKLMRFMNNNHISYDFNYNKDEILKLIRFDKKIEGEYLSLIYCEKVGSFDIKKILISEMDAIL